jgi:hypothetical protein
MMCCSLAVCHTSPSDLARALTHATSASPAATSRPTTRSKRSEMAREVRRSRCLKARLKHDTCSARSRQVFCSGRPDSVAIVVNVIEKGAHEREMARLGVSYVRGGIGAYFRTECVHREEQQRAEKKSKIYQENRKRYHQQSPARVRVRL